MTARTWIFQATPTDFGIADFVDSKPASALWRVSRSGKDMRVGDRVYLWHGKGKDGSPGKAGIIGRAVISGPLEHRADTSPAAPFWTDPADAKAVIDRIEIRFDDLRHRALIGYDELKLDPVFGAHQIFTFRQGSNFAVRPEQADRLSDLWENAGKPFTDDERLAALVAAAERRDATWLSRIIPRLPSISRKAIMAADPANAARYGTTPGPEELALWDRYMGAGGLGLAEARRLFEEAWPLASAAG